MELCLVDGTADCLKGMLIVMIATVTLHIDHR